MKIKVFLLLFFAFPFLSCTEQYEKAMESYEHFTGESISSSELKQWIQYDFEVVIIDLRLAREYKASHIPGAINIEAVEIESFYGMDLPFDTPVVIYHNVDARQKDAYKILVGLGFENVYQLYGGFTLWNGDLE